MLLDDGVTCVEINECTMNTDDCEQECINIEGGFRCDCFEGYILDDNGRNCLGIVIMFTYTLSCLWIRLVQRCV